MRLKRYSISCGLFFILLATLLAAGQEHLPAVIGEPIPRSYFGIHVKHETQTWPTDVAFGDWRLLDNDVLWRDLEGKGRKQWTMYHLNDLVGVAEKHHVEPLYTMGFTPTWASARPNETVGRGSAAEPKDMQDWREYVQSLATQYKGRIHDWEIWNEANDKAFYSGSIEQMVKLAQAAYEILKQVDPNNTVIAPSVTYGLQGTSWLDSYLKAGGGKYADVIAYHLYVKTPEDEVPLIQKIRNVMAANGVENKPLWNTETGWAIENKTGDMSKAKALGLTPISSSEGGAYAIRVLALAWDTGVSRYYWYTWDNQPEAMVEPDGTSKSAGVALAQGVKWLSGAVMTSCDSDSSGTWICHLTRDRGYNGYIVWNTLGRKEFSIPAAWHVQMERDMFNNAPALKGSTVSISGEPILLETRAP
jgi:Glycosyl hydrolase catalytic core